MSIHLTPKVEKRIQDLIDRGAYPDADAVVNQALQVLEEQEQNRFLRLRELVQAGFASGDGGEGTPELWADIAREADEADRLGLPIRREIQP